MFIYLGTICESHTCVEPIKTIITCEMPGVACSIGLLISITGSNLWAPRAIRWGIAVGVQSVFLNILLTLLIVGRLLYIRRKMFTCVGLEHGRQYVSISAMLIESATLYSVCAVMFLICYALNSYVQNLIISSLMQVQVSPPPSA